MSSLAVVNLPGSDNLQLFVGGYPSGSITLSQTGSGPGSWTAASLFPLSGTSASDFDCIGACQNENGMPQVWGPPTVGTHGWVYTRYRELGATTWTQPALLSATPIGNVIAAGLSAPGRVQLFANQPEIGGSSNDAGKLITCWQSVPNQQSFNAWSAMAGAPTPGNATGALAVHNLPDKRLQLWCCTSSNQLFTCWKESTKENVPWSTWTAASLQPGKVLSAAGGVRADGRVEVWCLLEGGSLVTSIQSSWPSASVSSWEPVSLPAGVGPVYAVAVGKLSDTRLQIFILAANTHANDAVDLYTCWQSSTAASAAWSAWTQLATSI